MLEIIERNGNEVYWRYKGLDGVSVIYIHAGEHNDSVAVGSVFCDTDIILSVNKRNEIKREIIRWLEETGEKEKWLTGK
jgi:hypothetical protein